MEQQKWEYDVEVRTPNSEKDEIRILDERGKKRWELCSTNSHTTCTGTVRYYWKRVIIDKTE